MNEMCHEECCNGFHLSYKMKITEVTLRDWIIHKWKHCICCIHWCHKKIKIVYIKSVLRQNADYEYDLIWYDMISFLSVQMCQRTFLFGLSMKHMPLFSCTSTLHILRISIIQFVAMFLIQSFWTYFCKEFCVFCFSKEFHNARNEIHDIYIDFLRFYK